MKLYKYQPITKYSLSNLSQRKNWIANPFDFNDPFEFRMSEIYYTNKDGKLDFLNVESANARILYKESLEKFGVVCYSSNALNTLMYSHYADHHKGMCLEFEIPNDKTKSIKRVSYKDQLEEFNFTFEKELLKKELIKICITKSKAWKYENEYRQIFYQKHFLANYPGKLTGIIFGCKTSKSDIELVVSILGSDIKNIEISKAFISANTYLLGKTNIPVKEDGTFNVPDLWDRIHTA
jgi:hypothetical protein